MSSENISRQLNIGDVSGGNYLEIQEDGSTILKGDASMWEDLRFPASAINPVGAIGGATVDNTSTFLGTLLFSPTAVEVCSGQAQLPHARMEGSDIKPHVHWCPTSSGTGNVLWQLDYQYANREGTFPGVYTTLQVLSAAGGVLNKHISVLFPAIDGTDLALSCMILWKISRIGSDITDTYPADARLLEFDIHYIADSLGSREERIK